MSDSEEGLSPMGHEDTAVEDRAQISDEASGVLDPWAMDSASYQKSEWDDDDPSTVRVMSGTAVREITHSKITRASVGHLVCLSPTVMHEPINLTPGELVLGRHPDCDIIVFHPSISRKHCRLSITKDAILIEDLGSENGTLINSKQQKQGALHTGDSLTLGEIGFRLLEVGDVFKPTDGDGKSWLAPQTWTQRRRFSLGYMLSVGLLCLAAGLLIFGLIKKMQRPAVYAYTMFLDGKSAYEQADWKRARARFEGALEQSSQHNLSESYLEAIDIAQEADIRLHRIEIAIAQNEFAWSNEELEKNVPYVLQERQTELKNALAQAVDLRMSRVRTELSAGRLAPAQAQFAALAPLATLWPDLRHLAQRVQSSEMAHVNAPSTSSKVKQQSPSPSTSQTKRNRASRGQASAAIRAAAAFEWGELERAISLLRASSSTQDRKILKIYENFSNSWKNAVDAHRKKRLQEGLKHLQNAAKSEKAIMQGKSLYARQIKKMTADMHYIAAAQARQRGQRDAMLASLKRALKADPKHGPSLSAQNAW